jgi:hypothetical protein
MSFPCNFHIVDRDSLPIIILFSDDQENVIVFAVSLPVQKNNQYLYFPHILQWLYNWALNFPNVLAKEFVCVFPEQNTYNLLHISYACHVVITDCRTLECGIVLGSNGITCIWSVVETVLLVQHHSASQKWLSVYSDHTDSSKYHMSWSQRNITTCAS